MDATYIFLQQYWWFLVSLLGALLVFLLFVQGGNSLLFTLGRTEEERTMLVNSTGRKWEFTFTTLVTFGGAFFASFPLFYSTSFGGAYWLWMIILFSFVLQAVSYEFQSKLGNLLGKRTYQRFLVLNGIVGPLLLGAAVATFFNGSNFMVSKGNLTDEMMPVISQWANGWHGLDAFADPWNLVLGFAVFFLARLLGTLYFLNNIRHEDLNLRSRRQLVSDAVPFLVFFLAFVIRTLLKDGFAVVPETGEIYMEPFKYFHNLLAMPYLGDVDVNDPIYQNTRCFVWSDSNPYFFSGKAGEGIGGPHIGYDMVWPMSIMMKAFTSRGDAEIKTCIKMLMDTDAGTGFMHESFHKDDATNFTRPWFAWQNTLFGELILKLVNEGKVDLLNNID